MRLRPLLEAMLEATKPAATKAEAEANRLLREGMTKPQAAPMTEAKLLLLEAKVRLLLLVESLLTALLARLPSPKN